MKTLEQFVADWNLQAVMNFDGQYGNQCVDLFRYYLKEVLGVSQPPGVKGAKELATNYNRNDFIWIPNTPGVVFQRGDIPIWGDIPSNVFGHVAVGLEASPSSSTFKSFDLNFPSQGYLDSKGNFIGTGKPHIQTHSWNENIIGWLRPKKQPENGGTMPETMTVNKSDWDRLLKASQLGDRLLNGLGADPAFQGNIADKSTEQIDSVIQIRNQSALDKAKKDGYNDGSRDTRAFVSQELGLPADNADNKMLTDRLKELVNQGNNNGQPIGNQLETVLTEQGYRIDSITIKKS